jgi:hypothetical protein
MFPRRSKIMHGEGKDGLVETYSLDRNIKGTEHKQYPKTRLMIKLWAIIKISIKHINVTSSFHLATST